MEVTCDEADFSLWRPDEVDLLRCPDPPPMAPAPQAASRAVSANNSPARSLRRARHTGSARRRSELPEEIPVSVRPHWERQDGCESTEDLQRK